MKKIIGLGLTAAIMLTLFTGCAPKTTDSGTTDDTSKFDTSKDISVVSREDGSGTRGAFIELFGIEIKGTDGTKSDKTTKEAIIASKTDVMLTNIVSNEYSIGYISLGSLNDTVNALKIDGVEATAENVKSGTYKVSRPFNIATKGTPEGLSADFINFILSKEGQEVVSASYISVNDSAPAFVSTNPTGKITVAGSSSVTPIMEKLQEAYTKINKNAQIELQMTDSTAGMTGALEGTCDIGMASRELKDSEKAELTGTPIAIDGIAVIVNKSNSIIEMTSENIKSIFTGESTVWSDVAK